MVVSVPGDGGFMFAVQELATAVQERIGLVILLFNNRSYGNVLRDQRTNFANRLKAPCSTTQISWCWRRPLASAHRVASPDELRPVLQAALGADAPVLIEVAIAPDSEAAPWQFIHPQR
jgi:acetolactate synthase I/II/III large subunit